MYTIRTRDVFKSMLTAVYRTYVRTRMWHTVHMFLKAMKAKYSKFGWYKKKYFSLRKGFYIDLTNVSHYHLYCRKKQTTLFNQLKRTIYFLVNHIFYSYIILLFDTSFQSRIQTLPLPSRSNTTWMARTGGQRWMARCPPWLAWLWSLISWEGARTASN